MSYWIKDNIKISEQGWAGHFCCAPRCRFRRNTLVEKYDAFGNCSRYIVSTVGCMESYDHMEIEMIGANRYYETMVFFAKKVDCFWEADVEKQINLENVKCEVDYVRGDSDLVANKMHDNIVEHFCKMLDKGYFEAVEMKYADGFDGSYWTVVYHPFNLPQNFNELRCNNCKKKLDCEVKGEIYPEHYCDKFDALVKIED